MATSGAHPLENFFWLRCDTDAQPEIQELARLMSEGYSESKPELLKSGEWHTPYVQYVTHGSGLKGYFDSKGNSLTVDQAIAISSSCCAQVSYRNIDNSFDKAMMVQKKLGVIGKPVRPYGTCVRL